MPQTTITSPPSTVPGYGSVPRPTGAAPAAPAGYDRVDPAAMAAHERHLAQMARETRRNEEFWRRKTFARQLEVERRTTATGDNRALSGAEYALEAMDPKHRIGEMLNVFMDRYNASRPAPGFFDWLDGLTPIEQLKTVREVMEGRGHVGVVKPEWIKALRTGVIYMDRAARGSYAIGFEGGRLYRDGKVFDTAEMRTEFSGKGVAIFVESPDGTFYSSSHVWGRLHHSSYLSGEQVRCAGEWKVTNGRIDWLTGKSGHYKPTMNQLVSGLDDLRARNALGQAVVKAFHVPSGTMQDTLAAALPAEAHYFRVWE